jgi:outer membrane protein
MNTSMSQHLAAAALLASLASPAVATAQSSLTLDGAVSRAATNNPNVRASRASEAEALARVDQARSVFFPRVEIAESWQRGNQPVFVFGSLLAQRSFGPSNFDIAALNHPDPLTNVRTAVTAEQVVFDAGRMNAGMHMASLGAQAAALGTRDAVQALKVAATQAYGGVLMAQSQRRAAESAIAGAQEDVLRAEHRRDATEADVLAVRVHFAQMRQRAISAASAETIARAQLNEVMGEPIDTVFQLQEPVPVPDDTPPVVPVDDRDILKTRTDVARAGLQLQIASAQVSAARSAWFPQAVIQGAYEFNGGSLTTQVSSWTVGAAVRWNLFSGLADAARRREARAALERAQAGREQADAHARVEWRSAVARLDESRARGDVARTARAQARESQRIIRDRYEAGLASVSDVLRAATALLDADLQYTSAIVDVFVNRALVDRARGQ